MSRLNNKQSFGALLENVTQQRLSEVASGVLAELAKQLWYTDRDLVPVLQRELTSKLRGPEQKLRALYLVDLLRRFPCVSEEKAAHLKGFVSRWSSLKPAERTPRATQLVSRYQLDKLAYEWGLEEDVSKQMQDVLAFQTRHYAATQDVKTGYSDPLPARA
ncbi:hypothetical protein NG726_14390 [Pseudomonas sp. MOB-449]|nr:hypothetical protein [Pseudomonas sp. MOB-449]